MTTTTTTTPTTDEQVEQLERRIGDLEKELKEALALVEAQSKRINSDLAMKMAIAKLLS